MQLIPLLVLGLVCLLVLLIFGALAWRRYQQVQIAKQQFQRHEFLCTPHEWQVYRRLVSVLHAQFPRRYLLFGKVRVSDLIKLPQYFLRQEQRGTTGKEYLRTRGSINQKHIDFVLVDSTNSRILLCLELNDMSHVLPERQKRDQFLQRVFDSAHLPLVFFYDEQIRTDEQVLALLKRHLPGYPSPHP